MASVKGSSRQVLGKDGPGKDISYITVSWTIDETGGLVVCVMSPKVSYETVGYIGKVSVQSKYPLPAGRRNGEKVCVVHLDSHKTRQKAYSENYTAKSKLALLVELFFTKAKKCRTIPFLVRCWSVKKSDHDFAGLLTFDL